MTKPDGTIYPNNPCLNCGSTNHQFASCSKKDNVEDTKLFWQEIRVYIPSTRKRESDPILRFLTPSQSSADIHSTLTDSASSRNLPHHPRSYDYNFLFPQETNAY